MNSGVFRLSYTATWLLIAGIFGVGTASAQSSDEKGIHDTVEAYVEAFNRGDAEAVAAFWTEDGDYIEASGMHLKDRAAILAAFKKYFALNQGLKLQILITDLRFPADNLAVEDGISVVIPSGAPSQTVRYTAVYVKLQNQWKLTSVRESLASVPSQQGFLEPLQWLIGNWEDRGENGEILQTAAGWGMNGNFIVRSFSSSLNGNLVGSGVQYIGWDQRKKQIRSWTFDSSGGFGQGVWVQQGEAWVIASTSVLPNGDEIQETSTVTGKDGDTLIWQSKNRKINGNPAPDSPSLEIKRVKLANSQSK